MDNLIFKIVSNDRDVINVCRIGENDAWGICDFVISNEDRLISFFPKTRAQNLTPDLSKIFTKLKCKEFDSQTEYLFTLKEEESKKIVGLLYVKELQKVDGQGELAYCIDYNFEGKGIISKAVSKISSYAFQNLNLNRLEIIVHKTNEGSVKVAENCNFSWQQTLIDEYNPTGKKSHGYGIV